MIDEKNPAGRLYSILDAAAKKNDNIHVRQVWSEVLDCEESNDSEITKRVIAVYQLTQEVQSLLQMIPDINHELYLSSFPKIERAIFPLNLNSNWKSQKQKLDSGVIAKLQFCSEALSKNYSEESISEADLDDIKKQLEELFEFVLKSKIDPILRIRLLEELERIRSAISMFRINGAKGLKESLQATIGAVIANREPIEKLKKGNPDILSRLEKLLDMIDTFTSRVLKVNKILIDPVKKAIGPISKIISDS